MDEGTCQNKTTPISLYFMSEAYPASWGDYIQHVHDDHCIIQLTPLPRGSSVYFSSLSSLSATWKDTYFVLLAHSQSVIKLVLTSAKFTFHFDLCLLYLQICVLLHHTMRYCFLFVPPYFYVNKVWLSGTWSKAINTSVIREQYLGINNNGSSW